MTHKNLLNIFLYITLNNEAYIVSWPIFELYEIL